MPDPCPKCRPADSPWSRAFVRVTGHHFRCPDRPDGVSSDGVIDGLLDRLKAAERERDAIVADARAILDRPRIAEDCGCPDCSKLKVAARFTCVICGYAGSPAALRCTCPEGACGGMGAGRRGTNCPHGILRCPICADGETGETDAWDVVREVRAALAVAGPAIAAFGAAGLEVAVCERVGLDESPAGGGGVGHG